MLLSLIALSSLVAREEMNQGKLTAYNGLCKMGFTGSLGNHIIYDTRNHMGRHFFLHQKTETYMKATHFLCKLYFQ